MLLKPHPDLLQSGRLSSPSVQPLNEHNEIISKTREQAVCIVSKCNGNMFDSIIIISTKMKFYDQDILLHHLYRLLKGCGSQVRRMPETNEERLMPDGGQVTIPSNVFQSNLN